MVVTVPEVPSMVHAVQAAAGRRLGEAVHIAGRPR